MKDLYIILISNLITGLLIGLVAIAAHFGEKEKFDNITNIRKISCGCQYKTSQDYVFTDSKCRYTYNDLIQIRK